MFTSTISSECLIIRHQAATPVRNQAPQAPGPYTPLTFAIPRVSGAEVVTERYNSDAALIVEVEIFVVSLKWMKSIRAAFVAPVRGDVADAERLAVVGSASPSVARMNRSATPSWRSDLEMILFQPISNDGIDEGNSRSWPSQREIFNILRGVEAWLSEMRLCSRNTLKSGAFHPFSTALTQLKIHVISSQLLLIIDTINLVKSNSGSCPAAEQFYT